VKLVHFMALLILVGLGAACDGDDEPIPNRRIAAFATAPQDSFSWTVQFATDEADEFHDRGPVEADAFMAELRTFDWHQQVAQSKRLKRTSPTITLRHGSLDRYLAISGIEAINDPSGLRFYLFWARGTTGEPPSFIVVGPLSSVEKACESFFHGEIEALDEVFSTQGESMAAAFERE